MSVLLEQLDQYGYDIAESDSLTDPELLMEVMEAREELEEASTQEECDAVRESNRGKRHLGLKSDCNMLMSQLAIDSQIGTGCPKHPRSLQLESGRSGASKGSYDRASVSTELG